MHAVAGRGLHDFGVEQQDVGVLEHEIAGAEPGTPHANNHQTLAATRFGNVIDQPDPIVGVRPRALPQKQSDAEHPQPHGGEIGSVEPEPLAHETQHPFDLPQTQPRDHGLDAEQNQTDREALTPWCGQKGGAINSPCP